MNFIRGSHYPHDPAFADACDRIGDSVLVGKLLLGCRRIWAGRELVGQRLSGR